MSYACRTQVKRETGSCKDSSSARVKKKHIRNTAKSFDVVLDGTDY